MSLSSRIAQDRKMSILERKYKPAIFRARAEGFRMAANQMEDYGTIDEELISSTVENSMYKVLSLLYEESITSFGTYVSRGLNNGEMYEEKQDTDFYTYLVSFWIRRRGLNQAKRLSETMTKDLRRIIDAAVKDDLGIAPIAERIRSSTITINEFRAFAIAKTEVHNACNFASIETAKDYQKTTGLVLLKKWSPALQPDRTRDDHLAMEKEPAIPLDEKFNVGGEMMDRPGDPSASARNVVNCRCVLLYTDEEFE